MSTASLLLSPMGVFTVNVIGGYVLGGLYGAYSSHGQPFEDRAVQTVEYAYYGSIWPITLIGYQYAK